MFALYPFLYLEQPLRAEHDVGGLDVAVYHEVGVQILHRHGRLEQAVQSPSNDDDELRNKNPPTPCRFGKHPPAPENWPAIEERTVEGGRWRVAEKEP